MKWFRKLRCGIGSDNGSLPIWHQAIIWASAELLSIEPLGTNFAEILMKILTFSFTKLRKECRLRNGAHFVPGKIS